MNKPIVTNRQRFWLVMLCFVAATASVYALWGGWACLFAASTWLAVMAMVSHYWHANQRRAAEAK